MARLLGVEIPDDKIAEIGLTEIYGIGKSRAKKILDQLGIDSKKKIEELTSQQLDQIRSFIEKNYATEGRLKQQVRQNIQRLKDIRCHRGIRHKLGLPVRGQRTRSNARTRKGHSQPVGGLKRTLQKT
jgi:small subunit ribosomal protein S13